ncbi:MAG: hypothetical protein JSW19_04395 [Candidatus Bathyarchaeota archaeon]|nr:hypothetical protein [Candidatus Bathyarchaeota archaeon]UCD26286.1 MAG: hypothetical protein JSV75_05145 [Candidatus Bathyarchaeota archaeon]UCE57595.1 MAG: hypothetical protein JSW19_04395 [Candidatus Bathyarchaeota archaeon]
MDPKEILSKEISGKVGDKINKQTIREKVDNFVRHGNMFLLFEVINLRKEIESLKEEIKHQRRSGRSQKSAQVLLIP